MSSLPYLPPVLARRSGLRHWESSKLKDVGGLDELHPDLYPTNGSRPPVFYYGYPVDRPKLEAYALARGYQKKTFRELWYLSTGEDKDENHPDCEGGTVYEWPYIEEFAMEQICEQYGYDKWPVFARRNGKSIDMIFFYHNYMPANERIAPSSHMKEVFRQFSDTSGPKWYVDWKRFIWDWKNDQ